MFLLVILHTGDSEDRPLGHVQGAFTPAAAKASLACDRYVVTLEAVYVDSVSGVRGGVENGSRSSVTGQATAPRFSKSVPLKISAAAGSWRILSTASFWIWALASSSMACVHSGASLMSAVSALWNRLT